MISSVWGGADYPITQPYNPAVHCGIDIGCPSGTTIFAARAGVVERVQTGMTSVHVDGSTQRDFYLHGTSLVAVGQHVARGQAVIHSDTVQVDPRYPLTGPHLHFEVQDGRSLPGAPPSAPGNPLDPVPVLQQTFGPGGGTIGGDDMTPEEHAWVRVAARAVLPPRPASLGDENTPGHSDGDFLNIYATSSQEAFIAAYGQDGWNYTSALYHGTPVKSASGGGAEPTTVTLEVPAQTITGKLT